MDELRLTMKYIDTHAHLNLSAFKDDVDAVAKHCAETEVAVINVGTKERTSQRAVELARQYEHCYAIIGLHPIQTAPADHDGEELHEGSTPFKSQGEEVNKDYYLELAQQPKVVGIGECGFDYYHTLPDSYEIQEKAFITQIEVANEMNLPLMIHTRGPQPGKASPTGRSVYEDVYETLKQYACVPFNVHFYAGTLAEAEKFFELGGTISFTGVITFKNATEYHDVIKNVPLEKIHAETDCPYVAPVPHRGKRAEPWMVQEVYQKIAEIKGLDVALVRERLLHNARSFYNL
jgi:TatD DNase family protein